MEKSHMMKKPDFDLRVKMMRKNYKINSEDGSVLVLALVMLVLLSLLGISASRTAEVEIGIAGNEKTFRQNLYRSEGAAMAGVQMLENETDPDALKNLTPIWLHPSLPDPNIRSATNWDPANNNSNQAIDTNSRYLSVYRGIAPGSSLDIGATPTTLHQFSIYGRAVRNNGEAIIEIGYRRRF